MANYYEQINRLKRIITIAEKLIADIAKTKSGKNVSSLKPTKTKRNKKRLRRTGKELTDFRAMLKAEREKGTSVAELAKKHRISTYLDNDLWFDLGKPESIAEAERVFFNK